MNKHLTFHADPAHGWLEVNRADLKHRANRLTNQADAMREAAAMLEQVNA